MLKRATRIILSAPRTSRTVTLFNNLSWLPFTMKHTSIAVRLLSKKMNGTIQLIYDSTPRDLTYLYLAVLLSLFSFSTLDICSWKVKRFVLINILPSAVYF